MTGCEKVPIQKVWPTYTNETSGRKIGHFCTFLSIFLLSSGPVSQQHDMKPPAHLNSQGPFPVKVSQAKLCVAQRRLFSVENFISDFIFCKEG